MKKYMFLIICSFLFMAAIDAKAQAVIEMGLPVVDAVEESGFAIIPVVKDVSTGSHIGVFYEVIAGSAEFGSDYTVNSGSFTMLRSQRRFNLRIPLKDDNVFDGTETFKVRLVAVILGDGRIGSRNTTEVFMTDNDFRPIPGDLDFNCKVDFADFSILSANYGRKDPGVRFGLGDLDRDGEIGFRDFITLSQNYNQSCQD